MERSVTCAKDINMLAFLPIYRQEIFREKAPFVGTPHFKILVAFKHLCGEGAG